MVAKSKAKISRKRLIFKSVGYVKSGYQHYNDIPRPHSGRGWTDQISKIILYPEHARKLGGLEGYSHIIVLYWIHKAREWRMPKDHGKPARVKLFATRMPTRPNPDGISVVKLINFSPETGELTVKGLDALDASPVLDIKPYIADFDSYPEAALPDWVKKHLRKHHHIHNDHK